MPLRKNRCDQYRLPQIRFLTGKRGRRLIRKFSANRTHLLHVRGERGRLWRLLRRLRCVALRHVDQQSGVPHAMHSMKTNPNGSL